MSLNLDERVGAKIQHPPPSAHRHGVDSALAQQRKEWVQCSAAPRCLSAVGPFNFGRHAGRAAENRPTGRVELLERQGEGGVPQLGLSGADGGRSGRQAEQIKGAGFYFCLPRGSVYLFLRGVCATRVLFLFLDKTFQRVIMRIISGCRQMEHNTLNYDTHELK